MDIQKIEEANVRAANALCDAIANGAAPMAPIRGYLCSYEYPGFVMWSKRDQNALLCATPGWEGPLQLHFDGSDGDAGVADAAEEALYALEHVRFSGDLEDDAKLYREVVTVALRLLDDDLAARKAANT